MHSNIPIIALQLIYIFNFIFPLLPQAFSTGLIAKPGCQDRCGNLSIPYPFGVGSDCSLDPSFTISCNTFTDPPKAYLSNIFNIQVIEINETYIRVRYPYLISACYDLSDYQSGTGLNMTADSYKHSINVNLSGTPYSLSSWNKLIAIGCDDVVLQPNGSYVSGGCSAVCTDKNDTGGVGYCPYNATSLGNGCCQAYISSGTTFLRAQLIDLSGKFVRRKLFPCSYAFVMEMRNSNETVFSYPLYYLDNSSTLLNDNWASTTRPPVVRLDWKIGAENCTQAKLNPNTYACRDEKSVCVGLTDRVEGYQCSCVPGYEGNPYLTGGCRAISFSSTIAKFGCPDQCGKLSIPFPFGVGRNCYLEPSFEIICNTSTNPPKPYLRVLNKEIVELNSSQVMVNYPNLGLACYHLSDYDHRINKTDVQSLVIDLSRTQYTLSDENWITAIGCDDMVVGIFGQANQSFIRSGCANVCWNRQLYPSYHYGYCPDGTTSYWAGDGCCRTPIPSGTTYLEANLSDLSGRWPRTDFSCSYAFVQHIDDQSYGYSYPIFDNLTGITLDDLLQRRIETKMALDWRIGAINCEAAQRNLATFACKGNTTCVDFDATVGGYLCNCSVGYQGNPYLTPGCRDIDECVDDTTNPCHSNSICINTPGSAHCLCRKGYSGDGRKDGSGCVLRQQSKSNMIIGLLGTGLGFLLLLPICFWFHKVLQKRKLKKGKEDLFKHLLQKQTNEDTFGRTKLFPAKELEKATDHFNENRILGKGGQGIVYKGMLHDGTIVAIKKLKHVDEDQVEQFINEVVILSQINHRNVVRLLGCCLSTQVPLLVYEFLPNGTLFDFIHDSSAEFPVSWNMRLKIATDVAGALAYLHSASSMPIYHRDIKSSNFLLDEKWVVKVADFGISRSVAVDQTHLTTIVKGTFGYFDPEYFQSRQYTEKSDVFSFGVVLAELLTGRKPIFRERSEEVSLATYFPMSMEENNLDAILDPHVSKHNRKEEVIAVARLAKWCLNRERKNRPAMKEVSTELETIRMFHIHETIRDEFKDARIYEANTMMISNNQDAWTTSSVSETHTASSDIHPLMFESL